MADSTAPLPIKTSRADALQSQYNIEIDKRKIVLDAPIKAYGTYTVDVKLYPEIAGKLNVLVYGE